MSTVIATRGSATLVDEGNGQGHVEVGGEAGPSLPLGAILKWGYWVPTVSTGPSALPGERELARKYEAVLGRIARRTADRYRNLRAAAEDEEPVDEQAIRDGVEAALRAQMRKVAVAAAKEQGAKLGVSFKVVQPLVLALVKAQAGRQAERITAGVRDAVARVVARSLKEGWTVPETADRIYAKLSDAKPWQATMLARTDLISLSNGGSYAAAQALGDRAPLYKRWVNADDDRVRPTHVEANMQVVKLDQPFKVGDALLLYPGDPAGPDGEVINCRCTLIYTDDPEVLVSAAWDESKHPRHPRGRREGGQFRRREGGQFRRLARDETFFHVTPAWNRESIEERGLRPTSEVGVSPLLDIKEYEVDGTFLATSARQAQALVEHSKDAGFLPAIYAVDIPAGTEVAVDPLMPESSVVVPGGIEAGQLTEMDEDTLEEVAAGEGGGLAAVEEANPDVLMEVREDDDSITLDAIFSIEKGQGHASRALDDLAEYADSVGKPIYLTPDQADDEPGSLTTRQLEQWYRRHGWVKAHQTMEDYEHTQSMVRRPRALTAAFDESKVRRWARGTRVEPTGEGGGRFRQKTPDSEQRRQARALLRWADPETHRLLKDWPDLESLRAWMAGFPENAAYLNSWYTMSDQQKASLAEMLKLEVESGDLSLRSIKDTWGWGRGGQNVPAIGHLLQARAEAQALLKYLEGYPEREATARLPKVDPRSQGIPDVYLTDRGTFKPGFDAKLKSDLVASALEKPNIDLATGQDRSLATFPAGRAREILVERGWGKYLEAAEKAVGVSYREPSPLHLEYLARVRDELGPALDVRGFHYDRVQEHVADLAHFPPGLLRRMAESGGKVYLGVGTVPFLDDLSEFAGQHPPGWSGGSTWKAVDGAYDSFRKAAVAGTTKRSYPGSVSAHEFGHMVGDLAGVNGSAELEDWRRRLRPKLSNYSDQRGDVGSRELWATGVEMVVREDRNESEGKVLPVNGPFKDSEVMVGDEDAQEFKSWVRRRLLEVSEG